MPKNNIDKSLTDSTAISTDCQQVTFNAVRKILPDSMIERACVDVDYHYRRRRITPIITVLHMIMTALWPEESFNACWHVLWDSFVSWCAHTEQRSPSRGRVAEARARLPLALWQKLFQNISRQAQYLSRPYDRWRGHRIVLADGTCLSMGRQQQLIKAFGVNTGYHGRGRYPLARLVTLCMAQTMTVLDYALGGYRDGETTLMFGLLGSLQKGDLLVADRHFAAAHFYVRYQRFGLEFLTRAHQCMKISKIKRRYEHNSTDFIGRLNVNKVYRRKDPSLPGYMDVRFIKANLQIRGRRRSIWFVTSLLDANKYPAAEIIELYDRRWRIETLLRQVKIRLSADVLRSRTPDGVRKEVAARLTALNVVRSIMLEAATEGNVEDPLRISFAHAVRAIISFSPALSHVPAAMVMLVYRAMLTQIAAHRNPERPGRLEPRAVCRERKHYPSLRITRAQWRKQNAA